MIIISGRNINLRKETIACFNFCSDKYMLNLNFEVKLGQISFFLTLNLRKFEK